MFNKPKKQIIEESDGIEINLVVSNLEDTPNHVNLAVPDS